MVSMLLIEDDPRLGRGLQLALGRHGHEIRLAPSGEEGLDQVRSAIPDLVVLDLALPGIDGIEVCRRIRAASEVPIIILTASGDDFDIVDGLDAGADDYVVKPVQPSVLDARVRAVLRRSAGETGRIRNHGDLRIDPEAPAVWLEGCPLALTPTELRLLLTLSRAPGRVFSRQQLLEEVWGHDYLGDSRLVDNCVQRLRAKVEHDSAHPEHVETVRGFGYRFGPA